MNNQFLFTLHQLITSILCVFFLYISWKDHKTRVYKVVETKNFNWMVSVLVSLFAALCGGLSLAWGSVSIQLALSYALLITLSFYHPKYAISFFIFLLISRPWEFFPDPIMMSMPKGFFAICLFSLITYKVLNKNLYLQWGMAASLMLLYACWVLLSIIPQAQGLEAFNGYIEVFVKGILVFFLIQNIIDKKVFIIPIQTAFVLGVFEKAVMTMHQSFVLGKTADGGRLMSLGILENSNDIAAIFVLVTPFTIAFFMKIKNTILKAFLCSLVFGFYTYLVWESKSRGAILGLGMVVLSWHWIEFQKKKMIIAATIGIALISAIALSGIQRNQEDRQGSTSNRMIYWGAALNMGLRNPFLGVGYGNYSANLLTYTDGHVGTEGINKTAHSTWLLALAETGVAGFLFYIAIWSYALKSSWSMRFDHPEFFVAIMSYGLTISFLSHTYMLYPYILLGLSIGLGQFYTKTQQQASSFGLNAALRRKELA